MESDPKTAVPPATGLAGVVGRNSRAAAALIVILVVVVIVLVVTRRRGGAAAKKKSTTETMKSAAPPCGAKDKSKTDAAEIKCETEINNLVNTINSTPAPQ
jgi:hypothetical protein